MKNYKKVFKVLEKIDDEIYQSKRFLYHNIPRVGSSLEIKSTNETLIFPIKIEKLLLKTQCDYFKIRLSRLEKIKKYYINKHFKN